MTEMLKTRLHEVLEDMDVEDECIDRFQVLKVQDKTAKENNVDPVTSTTLWKHYFKLKTGVFKGYADGMRNMHIEMDKILKLLGIDDEEEEGSLNNFRNQLTILKQIDKKMYEKADKDRHLTWAIKNELDQYNDREKDIIILNNCTNQLNKAQKEYQAQIERFHQKQKKYTKKAFKIEKTNIKLELMEKDTVDVRKEGQRLNRLAKKAPKYMHQAKEEFNKLKQRRQEFKQKSKDCTDAKTTVDSKRADFILKMLEEYAMNAKTGQELLAETNFKNINTTDVVRQRMPKHEYDAVMFERYKGTENVKELIEMVKQEIADEKARKARGEHAGVSSDDDDDDDVTNYSSSRARHRETETPLVPFSSRARHRETETPVVPFSLDDDDDSPRPGTSGQAWSKFEPAIGEGSQRVKGIGRNYLVTTNYKKQADNQISLTIGKTVKLIMPPNENGFAFGEKKGRFGKKKKGYFPMEYVVSVD